MSLTRRYSTAVLAASVLLLGACGGESAPTNPTPETPEINDNPRIISISPGSMIFESENAVVPAPQTLATSGLVAIGSAVTFGSVQYGEATAPWLRINPTPAFQREPLAWLHQISIDPAAFNALPDGTYLTATVPVIVVAALNSPIMLRVSLCKDLDGCRTLRLGDVRMDEFKVTDLHWQRGSNLDAPGSYPYHDWRLLVEPGQTVYVQQIGSAYVNCSVTGPLGTSADMYLYLFDLFGSLEEADDDSCGFSSEIEVSNFGPTTMEWHIRSTTFASAASHLIEPTYLVYGTYTIRVVDEPYFGAGLRAEPTFDEAAKIAAGKARGTP